MTKSIPKNSIAVGNPTKVIGAFDDYEEFMLKNGVSNEDLGQSKNYKERILSLVEFTYKPFLKKKNENPFSNR